MPEQSAVVQSESTMIKPDQIEAPQQSKPVDSSGARLRLAKFAGLLLAAWLAVVGTREASATAAPPGSRPDRAGSPNLDLGSNYTAELPSLAAQPQLIYPEESTLVAPEPTPRPTSIPPIKAAEAETISESAQEPSAVVQAESDAEAQAPVVEVAMAPFPKASASEEQMAAAPPEVALRSGGGGDGEPAPSTSTDVVITASKVNRRSGPGTTYSVEGQVSLGDTFSLLEHSIDMRWMKVKDKNGNEFWISAEYAKVEESAAQAPDTQVDALGTISDTVEAPTLSATKVPSDTVASEVELAEIEEVTTEQLAAMLSRPEYGGDAPLKYNSEITAEEGDKRLNEAYIDALLNGATRNGEKLSRGQLKEVIEKGEWVDIWLIGMNQDVKEINPPSVLAVFQFRVKPAAGLGFHHHGDQSFLLRDMDQLGDLHLNWSGLPTDYLLTNSTGTFGTQFSVTPQKGKRDFLWVGSYEEESDGSIKYLETGRLNVSTSRKPASASYFVTGLMLAISYPDALVDKPLEGGKYADTSRFEWMGKDYAGSGPVIINGTELPVSDKLSRDLFAKPNANYTEYEFTIFE